MSNRRNKNKKRLRNDSSRPYVRRNKRKKNKRHNHENKHGTIENEWHDGAASTGEAHDI